MKSGSSSALAFGIVLRAVRKRLLKNQADVAASLRPKLSVAAISMAEGGNRPPKSEGVIRDYADALELDPDALLELWWALQGILEIEDKAEEKLIRRWWRDLEASARIQTDHAHAQEWALDESAHVPALESFVFCEAICKILRRLLGSTWQIGYDVQLGVNDPGDPWPAVLKVELRHNGKGEELVGSFVCPEPLTRPTPTDVSIRPSAETISPDVAWILSSVETMPARERAAVAGFIRGLREGASLFS